MMAISLYEGSVSTYLQTLDAVNGYLDKGLAHFHAHGMEPQEIVETRLFPDMHPFRFQVQSAVFHSLGAVEAIRSGVLGMPPPKPPLDYAGLQALVVETRDALRKIAPEEINCCEGAGVVFQVRDNRRVFTAEGFLLSFSLPNFHFHATTAYNILRSKGVPVGKLDYVGALRLKG